MSDTSPCLHRRATLVRLAQESWTLLLNVHHIVFDGWSMDVLLGDLTRAYGALAAGEADDLGEPSIRYRDYARWQRRWMSAARKDELLDWWREAREGKSHGGEVGKANNSR